MQNQFRIIVLGCTGGPKENSLSGYLLYPLCDPDQLIAFDAGTMLAGIEVAYSRGNLDDFKFDFSSLTPVGELYQRKLKAYLISHAHLDHIAALVINSQNDTHKYILGLDSTIDDMRDHIFNWKTWPNCGNEGIKPIKLYDYQRLALHTKTPIPATDMNVEVFLLSHPHEYPSSAFLVEHQGNYMMYFGDTSPDILESEKHLETIWLRLAPLIREKKLRGILLECSVPDEDSGQLIFGHLNPHLMIQELTKLQEIAGVSLRGFKVVVTHRKETLYAVKDSKKLIEEELSNLNKHGLHLIFPTQGDKISL